MPDYGQFQGKSMGPTDSYSGQKRPLVRVLCNVHLIASVLHYAYLSVCPWPVGCSILALGTKYIVKTSMLLPLLVLLI